MKAVWALLRTAWGAIGASRSWWTLLAVGAVAAYFYVDAQHMRAKRDAVQAANDTLVATAEMVCAAAGQPFAASAVKQTDTKGRAIVVAYSPGQLCRNKVTGLASFRADVDRETAAALTSAMQQREGKAAVDARAARDAAEALEHATNRMETADAEAERRNVVDRDWWVAFNDLAGLRTPAR